MRTFQSLGSIEFMQSLEIHREREKQREEQMYILVCLIRISAYMCMYTYIWRKREKDIEIRANQSVKCNGDCAVRKVVVLNWANLSISVIVHSVIAIDNRMACLIKDLTYQLRIEMRSVVLKMTMFGNRIFSIYLQNYFVNVIGFTSW